ncbi:MAG: hypothetical protein AB7F22_24135 [Reyranella sp.]|uniref:hypothetical protein n=1 Tax=Reyranella sp. TaxID=1929291 RepID=UPI003D146F1F
MNADLSKCFDTIPHPELMRSVARHIVGRRVLRLIKPWLQRAEFRLDGHSHGVGIRFRCERQSAWSLFLPTACNANA